MDCRMCSPGHEVCFVGPINRRTYLLVWDTGIHCMHLRYAYALSIWIQMTSCVPDQGIRLVGGEG